MAKRNHNPDFRNMTCSKCGAKAHTRAGSQHRRCSGATNQSEPRPRHKNLPGGARGTWATPG